MLSLSTWVKTPQDRVWWWALLGPSLLILSLLALGLRASWPMTTLPFVVIVALPLCSLLGLRGLSICFALLVLGMAVDLKALPIPDRIWHMGVGAAISLALLLVVLAREEIQELLGASRDARSAERRIRELEEAIAAHEETEVTLTEELSQLRTASRTQLSEVVERNEDLQGLVAEKGAVLDQTRVSVWQIETRLEALLKEQAEQAVTDEPTEEHLLSEIALLAMRCDSREGDVGQLEELVSALLLELKQRSVPGLSVLQIPRA